MSEDNQSVNLTTEMQRKYPRKSFKKPVACLIRGNSNIVSGFEIGEGGLSFQSLKKITLDQDIIVNFFIPGGSFFSLKAKTRSESVAEDKSYIYGISFDNVSLALKREIRAYVSISASKITN